MLVYALVTTLLAVLLFVIFSRAPIDPLPFRLTEPLALEGALAQNYELQKNWPILKGKIVGPESLAVDYATGRVFTGLKNGQLLEIEVGQKESKVIKSLRLIGNAVGTMCDGSTSTATQCGRPLGIRLSRTKSGTLLVADAYLGIFEVDWNRGEARSLVSRGYETSRSKLPLRYVNDLVEVSDNIIVFTESSSKFDDHNFIFDLLEHRPNGRLWKYDRVSGKADLLADGLYFPNGIELLGKDAVVVAEMGAARLVRVDLSTGKTSIWLDGLPGYPDNIRLSKTSEQLYIGIPSMRSSFDDWLAQYPTIRRIVATLPEGLVVWLTSKFVEPYGFIAVVDVGTAKIVRTMQDPAGGTSDISLALDYTDDSLLFGSDVNQYIGRFSLRERSYTL